MVFRSFFQGVTHKSIKKFFLFATLLVHSVLMVNAQDWQVVKAIDFENPSDYYLNLFSISGNGATGLASDKCAVTTFGGNNAAYVRMQETLEAGVNYRIKVNAKGEYPGVNTLSFTYGNVPNIISTFIDQGIPVPNHSINEPGTEIISSTFTVNSNGNYNLSVFRSGQIGWVRFDNFILEREALPTPPNFVLTQEGEIEPITGLIILDYEETISLCLTPDVAPESEIAIDVVPAEGGDGSPHYPNFSETLTFPEGESGQQCFSLQQEVGVELDASYIFNVEYAGEVLQTFEVVVFDCEQFAGPDREICLGQSVQLGTDCLPEPHPEEGVEYCYSWEPSIGLNDPTIAMPIANPTYTTRYTVYVTSNEGELIGIDYVNLTVNGENLMIPPSEVEICGGEEILLATLGGTSYEWSTGSTESEITVSPSTTTAYQLTVTAEDGCKFTQDINVIVDEGGEKLVDLEMYRAEFIVDTGGDLVPESEESSIGTATFVNSDDDDVDGIIDNEDNIVPNGDNDLIRLKLKLHPDLGTSDCKLEGTGNLSSVTIWQSNDRTQEYTLGEVITLSNVENGWFVGELWVEGRIGHNVHREVKLKLVPDDGVQRIVNSDACSSDEVAITVMDFVGIFWEGKGNGYDSDSNDLTANTLDEAKGSYRVFPGKRYISNNSLTALNNKVEFIVKVEPSSILSDVSISVKSLDLDDPAKNKSFIDPNDKASNVSQGAQPYPGTQAYYASPIVNGAPQPKYDENNDNRGVVNTINGPSQAGSLIGKDSIGNTINMDSDGILTLVLSKGASSVGGDFEVSTYPGDNYVIAVSTDAAWLKGLKNIDHSDKEKVKYGGKKIAENQLTDKPLTVWRFLHIECDAMQDYTWNQNQVSGYFTNCEDDERFLMSPIGVNGPVSFDDTSRDMDPEVGTRGEGRFQKGTVIFHSENYLSNGNPIQNKNNVVYNGNDWLKILEYDLDFTGLPIELNNGTQTFSSTLKNFVRNDDNSTCPFEWELNTDHPNLSIFGNSGTIVVGDQLNLDVPIVSTIGDDKICTGTMKIPFVLRDDDQSPETLLEYTNNVGEDHPNAFYDPSKRNFLPFYNLPYYYRETYILPINDGGGNILNNNQNVPFTTTAPTFSGSNAYIDNANYFKNMYVNSYQDSRFLEEPGYWVTYIIVSWEEKEKRDLDPDGEDNSIGDQPSSSTDVGPVASTPAIDCSSQNIQNGNQVVRYFREVARERQGNEDLEHTMRTIAHEIGHTFGFSHGMASTGGACSDGPPAGSQNVNLMIRGDLSTAANNKFADYNINLLRSRYTSPGQ